MDCETNDDWAPLKGVRIIDFSMLLPGPLATQIFADLGAEVIKVEAPGGDYARHMKSAIFAGANRNKKSIVLDLKVPEAAAVVRRLAAYGDVAIEGFRPGVAARLGCDAETLQAINPRLVCCSLSGFGQTGPLRAKAGHDLAFVAMGG
ncbi:CoA transferase, partial [Hoeflea sp.]|uniref:CoA transferase n=1 Tax=Hoeflea sp. TaxID=1940281 RepID=UPI001987E7DE